MQTNLLLTFLRALIHPEISLVVRGEVSGAPMLIALRRTTGSVVPFGFLAAIRDDAVTRRMVAIATGAEPMEAEAARRMLDDLQAPGGVR